MDYFNEVLTNFLGLERCSCVAVYAFSASVMVVRKVKKQTKTVWPIHTSSIAVHFRDLVWLYLHQKQTVPEFAWFIPKTALFRLVYGSQVRTCLQENNVHIIQTNWTRTSIKPGSAPIVLVWKHQHPSHPLSISCIFNGLKNITFGSYCHELMWASKFLLSFELAHQPKDQSLKERKKHRIHILA